MNQRAWEHFYASIVVVFEKKKKKNVALQRHKISLEDFTILELKLITDDVYTIRNAHHLSLAQQCTSQDCHEFFRGVQPYRSHFLFKLPVLVDCCLIMNNYYHLQEANAWSQSNCSLTSWTFSTKGWLCPTEWSSCASSGEPLPHHRQDRQGLSSPRWSGRSKKTYADGTSRSTFCKKTVMSLKTPWQRSQQSQSKSQKLKKKKKKVYWCWRRIKIKEMAQKESQNKK